MQLTDIKNIIALLDKIKDKVVVTGGLARFLLKNQKEYNKPEADIILKDIKDLENIKHLISTPQKTCKEIWHGYENQRYIVGTKIATKLKYSCLDINKHWYLDVFVGDHNHKTIMVDNLLCVVSNKKNK